jgi:anti-sigma regulatory factor (Ser/Thr protein kinase)
VGETRVDLLHLLEDLADAYPGDLHETVLTEIVANALDSGASRLHIIADPQSQSVTVIDDGVGMNRADLRRYHDVATSTKERGQGIGFAGVGIKLGLLVSEEVITESRRGNAHISTTWTLSSRKRAPWQWIPPIGLVADRGTAVRLRMSDVLSPLLDVGFLEATLRRHFEPLLDPSFDDILRAHYPNGVEFQVNGRVLGRGVPRPALLEPVTLRLARKRKPTAAGYLIQEESAVAEERRGIAISTYGKIIKRGWDWLGVTPQAVAADRVSGLIEAPALAGALTLNKADFLRSGPRGALFLTYRKALQEVITQQLARWGDADGPEAPQHRRVARPIERDMEQVLADLAEDFPMLAMLVERRAGGKRKLHVGYGPGDGSTSRETMDLFAPPESESTAPPAEEPAAASELDADETPTVDESPREPQRRDADIGIPEKRGPRRPTRLGLSIQFESRPDDAELGRLVETTIWVNDAHPAYRRATASRSEGYHIALAVGMALAKVAVDAALEHEFVLEFLARWGEARDAAPRRKKRRR